MKRSIVVARIIPLICYLRSIDPHFLTPIGPTPNRITDHPCRMNGETEPKSLSEVDAERDPVSVDRNENEKGRKKKKEKTPIVNGDGQKMLAGRGVSPPTAVHWSRPSGGRASTWRDHTCIGPERHGVPWVVDDGRLHLVPERRARPRSSG